jgi:hypothetical protein
MIQTDEGGAPKNSKDCTREDSFHPRLPQQRVSDLNLHVRPHGALPPVCPDAV